MEGRDPCIPAPFPYIFAVISEFDTKNDPPERRADCHPSSYQVTRASELCWTVDDDVLYSVPGRQQRQGRHIT